VGVAAGALVIPLVLNLLADQIINGDLEAPQAFLMASITNGILGGGVDAASGGLDPSGGNIKQATLTTTVAGGIGSKISNVNEILKVELVDNIESTDSYAGTESSAV